MIITGHTDDQADRDGHKSGAVCAIAQVMQAPVTGTTYSWTELVS